MARNDGRFTPDDDLRAGPQRSGPAASVADYDDFADDDFAGAPEKQNEEPFLRSQKRVPVRKGPVTKKTAVRIRWAVIALVILAVTGTTAAYTYGYGMHSWRFRIESSDYIQTSGQEHVTRAQI